ncbi:hypothetical protein [Chitinimonas taiwanensis]|uniref:EpsG family protein n=1 Tax=Chitinimonas taiwanensis DSM 18899 TaxID=1121279 RepID=A0A1K2HQ48_9NEIS|nr:hypothetical protein [Chitinimonas taiwanensis]SFZ78886.1 hypothetical protein SAMN02745887_03242 [Chitinimonas taiwanensis DSM 18899]
MGKGQSRSLKTTGVPVWLTLAVSCISILVCTLAGRVYLSLDEDLISGDGYANQVAFVLSIAESGSDWTELDLLIWIHALRAIVAQMFLWVESVGGGGASAAMMVGLMWPVISLFKDARRGYVGLLLPCMMLILSYRSILVFLSVGYLLAYMIKRPSTWLLVVAFILANLSSGSVMTSLVITFLLGRAYRPRSLPLTIYMLFLFVSLAISVVDKYAGFIAGESGYQATVDGATGMFAIISRSTIVVSFLSGDFLRGGVYVGMLMAAVYGFLIACCKRVNRGYAVIFLGGLPAFMLEGLGVISLLVPVLLFLAGYQLPLRPEYLSGAHLSRRSHGRKNRLIPAKPFSSGVSSL